MSRESGQTSSLLRTCAVKIIESVGRPMASHEIEEWIRKNNNELSKRIEEKCADYVRIILGVTKDSNIVKYKSVLPIQGVDKRSTFYGVGTVKYNEAHWTLISESARKHRKIVEKKEKIEIVNIAPPLLPEAKVELPSSPEIGYEFVPVPSMFEDFGFRNEWSQNPWTDFLEGL